VKGEFAADARAANAKAYAALLVVRRAYAAGNADDYRTGATEAIAAIRALITLFKPGESP
jgi:hypothetical protein